MAKREKTWWAIKGTKGIVMDCGIPYLIANYKRAKSECGNGGDKTEVPVRVKLVEVE